jgi:hypothetical protein
MFVESDELGARFECMSSDPDVVGGIGVPALRGAAAILPIDLRSPQSRLQRDPGLAQEIVELGQVLFVALPS